MKENLNAVILKPKIVIQIQFVLYRRGSFISSLLLYITLNHVLFTIHSMRYLLILKKNKLYLNFKNNHMKQFKFKPQVFLRLVYILASMNYGQWTHLVAQCSNACENTIVVELPNCESISSPIAVNVFNYLTTLTCTPANMEIKEDITGVIRTNPFLLSPNDLCRVFKIHLEFDDMSTCNVHLSFKVKDKPRVIVSDVNQISATNFNAGHYPSFRVDHCNVVITDRSIEKIDFCNQIPRFRINYEVSTLDQCMDKVKIAQEFDVLSDLNCMILGPSRMRRNKGIELKIQNIQNGFPPFSYQWSAIGKDWQITPIKNDPTTALLIPGPSATDVVVNLDLFDRFGCKRFCTRQFSAIGNNDFLESRENNDLKPIITSVKHTLQINFIENPKECFLRILNLSGQLIQSVKLNPTIGNNSVALNTDMNGIYIAQLMMDNYTMAHKIRVGE